MRTGALPSRQVEDADQSFMRTQESESHLGGFPPQRVSHPSALNGSGTVAPRMYTEDEVSDMIQVSLSQLRKWRMKQNHGKQSGPPFKKLGRLVRYPAKALRAYIDGD
jgi:hypothetical protein